MWSGRSRPTQTSHTRWRSASLAFYLNVLLEHFPAHHTAVNIAITVHAHRLRPAVFRGGRLHVFDESLHRAVFRTADANAFLHARLIGPERFGVGNIHRVVLRDKDAAR